MTCPCGTAVTAESKEALIDPVLEHTLQAHPELNLSPVHVWNFLEAEERTAGSTTERLETIGNIQIVPIRPERAEEVGLFFDSEAFPDNFAWASCYCTAYFDQGDEAARPWQENRKATLRRVAEGTVTGSLAYVDGKLAGWCNASARAALPGKATGSDEGVCSLVCLVIAPPYRGHGLAEQLVDGAADEARRNGFSVIEAYPRRVPQSAADGFPGSLDMYQRAGFEVVSDDPLEVRLAL